jgi:hypothetical protein
VCLLWLAHSILHISILFQTLLYLILKQNQTSELEFDFKLILIINVWIILRSLLISTRELYTYLDKQNGSISVTDYNIKILNSKFNKLILSDVY